MSEYEEYLAEQYEGPFFTGGGGGGAVKKKKYKTNPTTIGKMRIGGVQPWGASEEKCPKGCLKKCCVKPV